MTQINADIPICKRTLNKGLCSDVKETTVIICMNVTLWGRRGGSGVELLLHALNGTLIVLF